MGTDNRTRYGARGVSLPPTLRPLLPYRVVDALGRVSLPYGTRLEELRLKRDRPSYLCAGGYNRPLDVVLDGREMEDTLVALCAGSLYAHSDTIRRGYLSLDGGIRVGLCGRASVEGGQVVGVYDVSSLCFRFPGRLTVACEKLAHLVRSNRGSMLIWAPPGVGKTTCLRAMAEALSSGDDPLRVCLVDSRGELGYGLEGKALCLDVLNGYPRALGIEIALRTLNAQVIVCDEIGSGEDASALSAAHGGGVSLIASAHAATLSELLRRETMRTLHRARVFGTYVGLSRATASRADCAAFHFEIVGWDDANALL